MTPEEFLAEVARIRNLRTKKQQVEAFRELFDKAPIPKPIRILQKLGLLLQPERHNVHHIHFESDFSSVNGWSDPVLNLIARPLARYYKSLPGRAR